jgi:hypothetical protein
MIFKHHITRENAHCLENSPALFWQLLEPLKILYATLLSGSKKSRLK